MSAPVYLRWSKEHDTDACPCDACRATRGPVIVWEVWTWGPANDERYLGLVDASSRAEAAVLADRLYGYRALNGGTDLRQRASS
jgi:hypothetical protein